MRKVRLEEIKDIAEYERMRPGLRQQIIELKKKRRVSVGEFVTLIFENRETARYQIQEMMRTERIVQEEKIREEIKIYNELVPDDNELSATMLIEIDDLDRLRQTLPKLIGIEASVFLKVGDRYEIRATYEKDRSTEETTSTVHYLKFPFTDEQVAAFQNEANPAVLAIDHPNYQAQTPLSAETRQLLTADLKE